MEYHNPVLLKESVAGLAIHPDGIYVDVTFGGGGHSVLMVDGTIVGHVYVERSVPVVFSMSGETFDVGMDTGAPVGDYPHVYRFTGEIHGVTVERLSEPSPVGGRSLARVRLAG